jgi:hypothetical protein
MQNSSYINNNNNFNQTIGAGKKITYNDGENVKIQLSPQKINTL